MKFKIQRWQAQLFRPGTPPSTTNGILVSAALLLMEMGIMLLLRQVAPTERMGALFLFGVLVVSAIWPLWFAVIMSVVSAITFDFVRDWPSGHPYAVEMQNIVVHASFLIVALTANALAEIARARTNEVEARRREAAETAEQQAALRRIATLVAHEVAPAEVFTAVVEEMAHCLHAPGAVLLRRDPGDEVTVVAACGEVDGHTPGDRFLLTQSSDTAVALGFPSSAQAPILVSGRDWGTVVLRVAADDSASISARVIDFAELVATAIANAHTREELAASRARMVTATDTVRRRLERDLHDGAQQRLASLRLRVGMTIASIPDGQSELASQLRDLNSGLNGVIEDLQEFSRGVHPAILSSGLRPAFRTLARRSAIPVTIDVEITDRLNESVEVAAYYVLAEGLANAAKYSGASQVHVTAHVENALLHMVIQDDGVGGASPRKGSGLIGLTDRVEALGGTLHVTSPIGRGTTLKVSIPLSES